MHLKQLEPKQVKVGDYNFYITPFPAFTAANLTGELASTLAPLLGVLASLVKEDGGEGLGDIDVTEAASAMSSCTAISGDKIENLMRKLLLGGNIAVEIPDEMTGQVEAERLTYDLVNEIFCSEVQDMFVLCFHVIKLNFNGFFNRLAGQSGVVDVVSARKKRTKY